MKDDSIKTIDQFINSYKDEGKQEILKKIRSLIKESVPEASEKISYGIPTMTVNNKNFIHFSAYENHIGIYPGPRVVDKFKDDLKDYETAKGTIKLPLNKPVPYPLISEIAKYSANSLKN